jgi:HK97 family phage major capsid protein
MFKLLALLLSALGVMPKSEPRSWFVHPFLSPIGYLPNGRPVYPMAGADGRTAGNPVITRLENERDEQVRFIDSLLERVESEGRDLVEAEQSNLSAARERIAKLDEQLKPLREFEGLREAHRSSGAGFTPTSNRTPDRGGLGSQTSRGHEYRSLGEFMADAWRAKTHRDEEAAKRLASVGRGIEDGRLTVTDLAVARNVDHSFVSALSPQERASAPNVTTVEIPGVLPVSITGQVINDIDSERPFLNSIGVKDMSGIPGKSFLRPTVTEHVQVAAQSAEKAAVQAGQFKIDDVEFTKATYGGYVDVSRQAIDWSSPAMWDALLADFLAVYARVTENVAADAFVAAVQAGTTAVNTEWPAGEEAGIDTYIAGLYSGAVAVYNGSNMMPDHVWMSLDMWATVGTAIDVIRATTAGNGGGSSDPGSLQNGGILTLPRTVVPSFPASTLIVGRRNRVEAYEERLGFLSAVEPKLLGVELAYGGYFTSGVLNADAFMELTFSEAA